MQQSTPETRISINQLRHLEYLLNEDIIYTWQNAGKLHPAVITYNIFAAAGCYKDFPKEIEL